MYPRRMRKLLACTRSTRHVGDFVFGGFFLFLHSAILLAHPGSRCPFAFFPFLGNGWIRRRTCYPREFWAVSEIVQLNGKRPGRWRRDVSDQMDERLHRLPIARGQAGGSGWNFAQRKREGNANCQERRGWCRSRCYRYCCFSSISSDLCFSAVQDSTA